MASVTVDTSEVDAYVLELGDVPSSLARHLVPVVKRAAQNVKTEMQANMRASGNAGFRQIANHISYDDISGPPTIETEIGIDKGDAGSLGNIAVYGTWKGGGTREAPEVHAQKELPAFESAALAAVEALIP